MSCTVSTIRAMLPPDVNAKFKDYRIERWIRVKKGIPSEVLKAIEDHSVNEDRLNDILSTPARKQAAVADLNNGVMSIIHCAERHEVVLYINPARRERVFNEQEASDAVLLCMTYFLPCVELLEGEGHPAICVIDMMEGASPSVTEIEAQIKAFASIVTRSFPKTFTETYLCCNWNVVLRCTVSAIASTWGKAVKFVNANELMMRLGKENTPTWLGGKYCGSTTKPFGDTVLDFVEHGTMQSIADMKKAPQFPTETTASWRDVLSRGTKNGGQVPVLAAALEHHGPLSLLLFLVLDLLVGKFLAAVLLIIFVAAWHITKSSMESDTQVIMNRVLDDNLADCFELLLPVLNAAGLEDFETTDPEKLYYSSLAMSACLSMAQKKHLKRCLSTIQDQLTLAPEASKHHFLPKWTSVCDFLGAVAAGQAPCPCGCNSQGTLDWLDAHLQDVPERVTAVVNFLGSRMNQTPTSQGSTKSNRYGHLRPSRLRSLHRSRSNEDTPDEPRSLASPDKSSDSKRRLHVWREELSQRWGRSSPLKTNSPPSSEVAEMKPSTSLRQLLHRDLQQTSGARAM